MIEIKDVYRNQFGGLEIVAIGDIPEKLPGFLIGRVNSNQGYVLLVPTNQATRYATERAMGGFYQPLIDLFKMHHVPNNVIIIDYDPRQEALRKYSL